MRIGPGERRFQGQHDPGHFPSRGDAGQRSWDLSFVRCKRKLDVVETAFIDTDGSSFLSGR